MSLTREEGEGEGEGEVGVESMWGFGGRQYWGRRERDAVGTVVVFAWMSSQDRHLRAYVDLFTSLRWNSLICHSQFLNMFFPHKAATLASAIVTQLVQELKLKPCPVVFASFSGGPKACMYKVLQIIEGKSEPQLNLDDHRLVRSCISGHIYDSSPVDFTSDLGTRFILHPTVLKMSQPPRVVSWVAHRIASGLDALFLSRFESHRAEYWQTLYSSVGMGAPYLIFYSDSDDLAPCQVICNFAQRLQDLGGDVKLVKFNGSPHVGHFRVYPTDYKANVTEFLSKAVAAYSQRVQRHEGERFGVEGTHEEITETVSSLRKAATRSNQGFEEGALALSDHLLTPNSLEYYDGGSMQAESKEGLIHTPSRPSMKADGVLGQILFDTCVPKNVEDWDIGSASLSRHPLNSTRRNSPFNPIKCMRRSRL